MIEDGVALAFRRIEELVGALESLRDPAARETARALLEVVLDVHALGLARMTATIAASDGGVALLHRLAEDKAARGILLLHGLHPEPMEVRIGRAVEALNPRLAQYGLRLTLIASTAKLARVRVRWIGAVPARVDAAPLHDEIEATIVDAAPELETLEIEGLNEMVAAVAS
jgi:hypothetical protein